MPSNPGEDDAPQGPATDGVSLDSFSGLRNTILPERIGPRELSRARNIDIDDAGQVHRRRGRTLVSAGQWHSLFSATLEGAWYTFGVNAGQLCTLHADFTSTPILGGMPQSRLSWEQVERTAYFTCHDVSGQVDLLTGTVKPWGARTDHDYIPSTIPAIGRTFWLTPVPQSEQGPTLGPVAGRLLGPPPFGQIVCYYQGRLYIAQGRTLWATELYAYNFVDKTSGYRQFEDDITGVAAVEDGLYVGTASRLYFLAGTFKDQRRTLKLASGVIPGTMTVIPGEVVDPEARRRPDVPHESSIAVTCMTAAGLVVGLKGGQTYNLTRDSFKFPRATRGATMFREMDGYNTLVTALDSGGTPSDNGAAFGDYVNVSLIRNGAIIDG